MDTRIVTTDADFDALAPAWLALEEADPGLLPQLTHAYVAAWVHERDDARLHVAVAEDHGELVGVLPLVVTERRAGPVRWNDLGFVTEGDIRDAVVDARRVAASSTVKSLLVAALEAADDVQRLLLRYLPADSPLTHHLLKSGEYNAAVRPLVEMPKVNLDRFAGFAQYRRGVPRSSLTSLNKLRRELGLTVTETTPVDAALYDELVALHRREKDELVQQGRRERRSLFEDPRRAAAYRALVVDQPHATAFTARTAAGELVFHELAWRRGRRVWAWNTAYNPDLAAYRPSRARIGVLEDLFARGDTDTYDLGAGRYPWKFELTSAFSLAYECSVWRGDSALVRMLRRLRP